MSARPPEPPPAAANTLTRDPVRWSWVILGLIQAVTTVLLATDTISNEVGAIFTGISLALYVAVSELFTRPATVPREPLAELAAAERGRSTPPPVASETVLDTETTAPKPTKRPPLQ